MEQLPKSISADLLNRDDPVTKYERRNARFQDLILMRF